MPSEGNRWWSRPAALAGVGALLAVLAVSVLGSAAQPADRPASLVRPASSTSRSAAAFAKLRRQRAAAIRQALATGRTTYTFEFEGPLLPPGGGGR